MLYKFTVHYVTTANIQLYQGMFTVLLAARSSHGSRVTQCKVWSFLSETDKFVRKVLQVFEEDILAIAEQLRSLSFPKKRKREPGNEVDCRDHF